MKRIGLDIGSTTIKCVVIDENDNILFKTYKRHLAKIKEMCCELLKEIRDNFTDKEMSLAISGSAGMGFASLIDIPFVQEVYATKVSIQKYFPACDCVIELGGEDAKIIFFTDGFEMRMNGTCAGGTGAFIDQMACILNVEPIEMNALASKKSKIYPIASRCGVFAKSDVQPLLNQGANKEDIACSIFYAVVNQTIAGLAQGRKIKGNVLYLGGPLTFFDELRKSFDDVLKIKGICPENSLYYVSLGSALANSNKTVNIDQLINKISDCTLKGSYNTCKPLFNNNTEYESFIKRHENTGKGMNLLDKPSDKMYLGIDAGSTTIKLLLSDKDGNIFNPYYGSNNGNPIPIVKKYLSDLYEKYPNVQIVSSAVTGYGEDIVKNAFHLDFGIVETIAHYLAAKSFKEDVDFILDIGGQDIKCFKIANGAIDNIYLNEACSSGCGSFLQTFAQALGYTVEEFANLGLFASAPVDLGSRCTVFMNSSVKQAQKDGASIENIAAGLSISVVKNALYKVIRCVNASSLGKNIVVQGGTFLNNSVLRAFEQEINQNVIRPNFSPLMGAYGCCLYAISNAKDNSTIINLAQLKEFTHKVTAFTCNGCSNKCKLTLNDFGNGNKYIAGNRCDKPLNIKGNNVHYDLYDYKLKKILSFNDTIIDKSKKTIGIPLGLNMYELLPFWYNFFKSLDFNVVISDISTRKTYLSGQYSIPSDTICYPAKLIHGHIENLLDKHVDAIFYPDMSYNLDEKKSQNHYNCPVVAYYPQVLAHNVKRLEETIFINEFISLHDKKEFIKHINVILNKYFKITKKDIINATNKAYDALYAYKNDVTKKGLEYIDIAKKENLPIIVLAGRPYHIDSEINHGINTLICKLGAVIISEDSISPLMEKIDVKVMNQWTYHSRLYLAAKYVANRHDININLVQLVSFGCGVDAITSDETRSIIESGHKIYTQIKIDEISNMGTVKIRLRSLFESIKMGERKNA